MITWSFACDADVNVQKRHNTHNELNNQRKNIIENRIECVNEENQHWARFCGA